VRRYYRGTDDLLNSSLYGVIVTGAEPRAASLTEEPYWSTFGEIIDWDAPSGGYLLQGSFVTGTIAGQGAAKWIAQLDEA
jgi:predicted flavoprotein YhiN